MELGDIQFKASLQCSWSNTQNKAQIFAPPFNIEIFKLRLLTTLEAPSENIKQFEFILHYLDREKRLEFEDDLYIALQELNQHDADNIITINIKEKPREDKKMIIEPIKKKTYRFQNTVGNHINEEEAIGERLYEGTEIVRCAFCQTSSKIKGAIETLGPFYGPFYDKKNKFYVHDLCAIWTSGIELDHNKKFINLSKHVARCQKLSCSHCQKPGAGLGCEKKDCTKVYHFKCALKREALCRIDENDYTLLCPEHAKEEDNRRCEYCDKGDGEDKMILCDKCTKGYHIYCLNPPLSSIPEGEWFCEECIEGNIEQEVRGEVESN